MKPRLLSTLFSLAAFVGLAAFDLCGLGQNFSKLHEIVRRWKLGRRRAPLGIAGLVCNSVNHACCWYPKRALCLQRAVVTTCLLRTCGVSAQMVLGARMLPFKAHAWVEVDGRPLTESLDVARVYGIWERC